MTWDFQAYLDDMESHRKNAHGVYEHCKDALNKDLGYDWKDRSQVDIISAIVDATRCFDKGDESCPPCAARKAQWGRDGHSHGHTPVGKLVPPRGIISTGETAVGNRPKNKPTDEKTGQKRTRLAAKR